MSTAPSRIEWLGPNGWVVRADEDGICLRSRSGETLEASAVARLIDLIADARDQIKSGQIPAPKPPTREEAREAGRESHERYLARTAERAVREAIAPTTPDMPF